MRTLTRTICLTFAVLLGSAEVSWSEGTAQLKPLSAILQEESSKTMQIYAIERCAALFLGNANQLKTRGERYKAVVDKLENKSVDLTLLSSKLSKNYGFERSMDVIQRRIVSILMLYVERWAHNSAATGNNLGPLTQSDIETCKSIVQATQK